MKKEELENNDEMEFEPDPMTTKQKVFVVIAVVVITVIISCIKM